MTMQIGYARVSRADGSQVHDLQRNALIAAGLEACLKALRTRASLESARARGCLGGYPFKMSPVKFRLA